MFRKKETEKKKTIWHDIIKQMSDNNYATFYKGKDYYRIYGRFAITAAQKEWASTHRLYKLRNYNFSVFPIWVIKEGMDKPPEPYNRLSEVIDDFEISDKEEKKCFPQ